MSYCYMGSQSCKCPECGGEGFEDYASSWHTIRTFFCRACGHYEHGDKKTTLEPLPYEVVTETKTKYKCNKCGKIGTLLARDENDGRGYEFQCSNCWENHKIKKTMTNYQSLPGPSAFISGCGGFTVYTGPIVTYQLPDKNMYFEDEEDE